MTVTSINHKLRLSRRGARGAGLAPGTLTFLAGAALTLLAPAALFCAVTGDWTVLFLMAANGALGVALGLVLFARHTAGVPPCVPAARPRRFVRPASAEEKKAA